MPLTSGVRLGTYEILGPLGAGGMGEVYRARDVRLGREVAVKVLPAGVAGSSERLARLEREARTVAGLNHPNIVTLFSVEDEDGIRFLTMELVEGQTLSDLIVPGGMPFARLLELSIPLSDALVAAHERGVIHRDLKPGNVMVTREGRVKVLDFGLAKAAGSERHSTDEESTANVLSIEGEVQGTVPYMAPEQLRGEPADARSDLFALGIILYELATGRKPFAGRTSAEVSSSILRDTPDPLNRVRSDLPVDLGRIVARCLEKNPRERLQSALDIANELRGLRRALERSHSDTIVSIAVLPFVNRSRDEEDEYFSDGLADELLNVLAKIRGLRVAARTSAFHFKGKDTTIAEIGSALHVATVLEGSVRKAGKRVRISVQLVNVADGYHLWSETYDRTMEDIFAVQDDIAQSVVKELRTTLLGEEPDSAARGEVKAEVAEAAKGRGTDPEAHRLYLLARHLIVRGTRADVTQGIEYLKEAVRLDPSFALAWADLSQAHCTASGQGWTTMAEGRELARQAAERALSIEPDLAEGHAALGVIQHLYDRDWSGAEISFRRALELAPGSATVLREAGSWATDRGRLEEAIELNRRSIEQDPLGPSAHVNLAWDLAAVGRFVEAEAAYRKAVELSPRRPGPHACLAVTLAVQGKFEEALVEAMRGPDEAYRRWSLAIVHHMMGNERESAAALKELSDRYGHAAAYQIAEVHAVRGETDLAFEWLERAYAENDHGLATVRASPHCQGLHADPRWIPFVRRMGFESP